MTSPSRVPATSVVQLAPGRGRVVLLDDAGRRVQDAVEWPPRDALAVGEAPTPQDGRSPGETGKGLGDQPALADAGRADDGHEVRATLPDHRPE